MKKKKDFIFSGTRVWVLTSMVIGLVVMFLMRLVELQVIRGEHFRMKADENRLFTRPLLATRGIFFDRNGVQLVENAPLYKKPVEHAENALFPEYQLLSKENALSLLEQEQQSVAPTSPVDIVVIDQKRTYVFGQAMSLVLGFTGEISPEDVERDSSLTPGYRIGKMGLERVLQPQLAGRNGKEVYEMDALGKLKRLVSVEQPVRGQDVRLTIDAGLTTFVAEQLQGKKGAVIVSKPSTGEVLAMVSSPSFDPEKVGEALKNPDLPLMNRAVSGTYPPGSTFKMMTALAALQAGGISANTEVEDTGVLKVGEFSFGNWYFSQYGRTEGKVDVVKALQRSNDIFFYKAAELAGPEQVARMARLFHFGARTGIELPGEAIGLIPDPEWKQKRLGETWYLGNTYHMGIGQGDVLVTPLQVHQTTAALANGGVWCRPRVVVSTQQACEELDINPEYVELVRKGMTAACAQGGTAYPFFDEKPLKVACKTGTAEFGKTDEKGRKNTHALFTMMAPIE